MVARKRFRSASWIYASLDTLKAGLFIVPALVTGQLGWLVGGAVAFAAARSLVAFWYLSREFGVDTLRPDAELLRRQLAYAVPFALSGIVETINTNLHQYAISYHFDAATFAIYAVGCLQIPLVDFLTTSSARVMMVRMAEEIRDGQSRVVVAVWRDTTRKLALVFFPLAVLLLLSGREIILFLFTERYAASVPVFMVSVLFLLMSPLQVDAVLRVYAQTRFLVVLNLVRLVFIAALITWFLAEFHLIGAILVTVLGTALVKGLALARIRGLLGVRGTEVLPWGSLARVLGAAGAAAVPVLAIKAGLELGPLAALLVTGPVYAAAYAGAAYLVGALTEHEWSTIRGVCERWAPGFAKAERLWRS
jgi:O-antigen/teichoic acid export membrane protein